MGPECHRFHNQRNTFLPMLCSRPSIKDVGLPIRCVNRRSPSPASSSGDDPVSPRISCIGQVKRNNRIVGFPTSHHNHHRSLLTHTTLIAASKLHTKNDNSSHVVVKYSKLKKLFSSKNLTAAAATNPSAVAVSGAGEGGRGRRRRKVVSGGNGSCGGESKSENCVSEIDIGDMDPPLPVIKRPAGGQEGESESLWKRRSGGVALRGLQLQQIQHPRHHLQPTTV
ncbi:myotubularin-like protein [Trema orientale]|uniref:Myotubularin-like protein n=1 Tax=Trema orientale TaxID=63057 RepID=A0A2P5D3D5_TREOI|nr:myotubularin-like protein [Trema orientale]